MRTTTLKRPIRARRLLTSAFLLTILLCLTATPLLSQRLNRSAVRRVHPEIDPANAALLHAPDSGWTRGKSITLGVYIGVVAGAVVGTAIGVSKVHFEDGCMGCGEYVAVYSLAGFVGGGVLGAFLGELLDEILRHRQPVTASR